MMIYTVKPEYSIFVRNKVTSLPSLTKKNILTQHIPAVTVNYTLLPIILRQIIYRKAKISYSIIQNFHALADV